MDRGSAEKFARGTDSDMFRFSVGIRVGHGDRLRRTEVVVRSAELDVVGARRQIRDHVVAAAIRRRLVPSLRPAHDRRLRAGDPRSVAPSVTRPRIVNVDAPIVLVVALIVVVVGPGSTVDVVDPAAPTGRRLSRSHTDGDRARAAEQQPFQRIAAAVRR